MLPAPLGFKVLAPPLTAMTYLMADIANSIPDTVRVWMDVAALAVFVAGILAVGRYKNALQATQITTQAYKDELEVYREKLDRVEREHRDLLVENTTLKNRPDLSVLADALGSIRKDMDALLKREPESSA